jgi:hypothetical protein
MFQCQEFSYVCNESNLKAKENQSSQYFFVFFSDFIFGTMSVTILVKNHPVIPDYLLNNKTKIPK